MTQLQIVENPLGSVGHTDSTDVGGITGLSVYDVGGCDGCYTEQGMLFDDDSLCVLTRHGDYMVWKSSRTHQCTQLAVVRPNRMCKCKVKRITFTCYLRKHTNTVCTNCSNQDPKPGDAATLGTGSASVVS
jgi:hypothetical protein